MKIQAEYLKVNKSKGFTIIEVMIAVAIVAIISAIGTNQYFKYIINSKISTAQTFMQDIAQFQERHYATNKAYAEVIPAGQLELPAALIEHYLSPVLFITTTHPKKYAVLMKPDPNSAIMNKHSPSKKQPTTVLAMNSEHQKWFETNVSCITSCNCQFDGSDVPWETVTAKTDWDVGSRTSTTPESWKCVP